MKWDVIYIYLLCARSIKENLLRSKYNMNAMIKIGIDKDITIKVSNPKQLEKT